MIWLMWISLWNQRAQTMALGPMAHLSSVDLSQCSGDMVATHQLLPRATLNNCFHVHTHGMRNDVIEHHFDSNKVIRVVSDSHATIGQHRH